MTTPNPRTPPRPRPPSPAQRGVRIAGTGSFLPDRRLTNQALEKRMETSDEGILQRTGIRERRIADQTKGESAYTMSAEALKRALRDANLTPGDVDLLIVATVCAEMACPSTACRVAQR